MPKTKAEVAKMVRVNKTKQYSKLSTEQQQAKYKSIMESPRKDTAVAKIELSVLRKLFLASKKSAKKTAAPAPKKPKPQVRSKMYAVSTTKSPDNPTFNVKNTKTAQVKGKAPAKPAPKPAPKKTPAPTIDSLQEVMAVMTDVAKDKGESSQNIINRRVAFTPFQKIIQDPKYPKRWGINKYRDGFFNALSKQGRRVQKKGFDYDTIRGVALRFKERDIDSWKTLAMDFRKAMDEELGDSLTGKQKELASATSSIKERYKVGDWIYTKYFTGNYPRKLSKVVGGQIVSFTDKGIEIKPVKNIEVGEYFGGKFNEQGNYDGGGGTNARIKGGEIKFKPKTQVLPYSRGYLSYGEWTGKGDSQFSG